MRGTCIGLSSRTCVGFGGAHLSQSDLIHGTVRGVVTDPFAPASVCRTQREASCNLVINIVS